MTLPKDRNLLTAEMRELQIGDRVEVTGKLYTSMELPYHVEDLACTVASGYLNDDHPEDEWIGIETGDEELDSLELHIKLDPRDHQPQVLFIDPTGL